MGKTKANPNKNLHCSTPFANSALGNACEAEFEAVLSNCNFKIALKTNGSVTEGSLGEIYSKELLKE